MNIGKVKLLGALAMLIVAFVAMSGFATAMDATIDFVKVNGDDVFAGTTSVRALDRANEFDIKVQITALADLKNAEIEAVMSGHDNDDRVSDVSAVFDMKAGVSYVKTLSIELPQRMDQDRYKLRIRVQDRDSTTLEETYEIEVETSRHNVAIKGVDIFPANGVQAGASLRVLADIRNYGQKDEEGVKVKFEIPDLGISALPDNIDIDSEDKKTSEELYVRIPQCAEPKIYKGIVSVEYDDGDEVATQDVTVEVLKSGADVCGAQKPSTSTEEPATDSKKVIVTLGSQSQALSVGAGGAIYPVTFTNTGASAKTFMLNVLGADEWATVKVSPVNTITVGAGETKSLYVYVSAKESATVGDRVFYVEVKDSKGEVMQQIPLTAVVQEAQEGSASGWSKVKKGLEVGLIVLVVLLVILGLIVAFNKMKGGEEEESKDDEVSGQTYY